VLRRLLAQDWGMQLRREPHLFNGRNLAITREEIFAQMPLIREGRGVGFLQNGVGPGTRKKAPGEDSGKKLEGHG